MVHLRAELSPEEQAAIRWRISELRSEISAAEREVEALKVTLGPDKGRTRPGILGTAARGSETLVARVGKSLRVFSSTLQRKADPLGFLRDDAIAGLRLASNLSLAAGYLQQSPGLVTHAPAIYARISQLEPYAPGILPVVEKWLPVIEPHLDDVLERLDDIEPHLPYVIENIDVLAPHCGSLLRHLDALLMYAEEDEAWLPELIEYVPFFAPRLDTLGPHLALLRPHMALLLPHMPVIARNVDAFIPFVSVSANADVLLHYFGWLLRVPIVRRVIFIPGVPRLIARMAQWLPKRPVRGATGDLQCSWDDCDCYAANAARYYKAPKGGRDVQRALQEALGRVPVAKTENAAGRSHGEPWPGTASVGFIARSRVLISPGFVSHTVQLRLQSATNPNTGKTTAGQTCNGHTFSTGTSQRRLRRRRANPATRGAGATRHVSASTPSGCRSVVRRPWGRSHSGTSPQHTRPCPGPKSNGSPCARPPLAARQSQPARRTCSGATRARSLACS